MKRITEVVMFQLVEVIALDVIVSTGSRNTDSEVVEGSVINFFE